MITNSPVMSQHFDFLQLSITVCKNKNSQLNNFLNTILKALEKAQVNINKCTFKNGTILELFVDIPCNLTNFKVKLGFYVPLNSQCPTGDHTLIMWESN